MMDQLDYEGFLNDTGLADDARYIPSDSVCPVCDRLLRDHAALERVLALRKIKYFDQATGRVVQKQAMPYCRCEGQGLLENRGG